MDDYHRLMLIEDTLADYKMEVADSYEYWHGDEQEEKSTLENINRALSGCRAMLDRKRSKANAPFTPIPRD